MAQPVPYFVFTSGSLSDCWESATILRMEKQLNQSGSFQGCELKNGSLIAFIYLEPIKIGWQIRLSDEQSILTSKHCKQFMIVISGAEPFVFIVRQR